MVATLSYRRSPHIVCYWKNGEFVFHSYSSGLRSCGTPVACDVLHFFDDWKTLEALRDYKPLVDASVLAELVDALVKVALLQRSDRPLSSSERAMDLLGPWNPEAGFFHSATKDVKFGDNATADRYLSERAEHEPMPPVIKRCSTETVDLPKPVVDGPLAETLLARRTWRRFGDGTIPLTIVGTLLGLTAGVQRWVDIPGQGRIALKTSPSGGARHPVELYVLALKIDGLSMGLYHYAPDVHALEVLQLGVDAKRVSMYLPNGACWSDACALILFSSVYERELWRYRTREPIERPSSRLGTCARRSASWRHRTVWHRSAPWVWLTRPSRPIYSLMA